MDQQEEEPAQPEAKKYQQIGLHQEEEASEWEPTLMQQPALLPISPNLW
jgi:hypothetical protein